MRTLHLKTSIVGISVAVGLAGVLAACGTTAPTAAPSGTSGSAQLSGTVTVFAAASLKATFTQLAKDFEAKNPGTKVALSFAGSSDLVTQISQGAPADVFASADTKNMTKLADAKLVEGTATNFATNVLEIAVPPSNPASISSLADLAKPGVKVVTCASQVPCGAATDTVEKASGVSLTPVSEESSVTDVLGKVTSGEADAGLVYVTDVKGAGDNVKGIPFPESDRAVNIYPIATVGTSKNKELAAAFIAAVTSEAGSQVLSDAGFGAP
ncbi:molybdate ABC transporter substrate-binding protein [Paenarthrobacter nitroguajacolicus]|uniref:Molybdate-binding protein ModA n=1 Tax=Paenarthrobacter nitroguajacolicus TaxID=211146 RepID=A0A558H4K2_PAENT|nr:molybdate ABC transporter substrate-binding protein [Paenarthrobacter nitroguajacolicus]TVU64055.1 molybdate ABC transporter substrate-binding protein [Paenarthrobacter nitroguajacolicus]